MGALAEIVSQWLLDGTEPLEPRLPALRALLLRSIGAPAGPGALAQRPIAGAGEA
jgi:hypothetical protein